MKIMRIKGVSGSQQQSPDRGLESSGNALESGGVTDGSYSNSRSKIVSSSQTPEGRIGLLRYRIDVETRLMEGANTIMKVANPNDKKSGQTVSWLLFTSMSSSPKKFFCFAYFQVCN